MACDCFGTINAKLAERNTRLSTLLILSDPSGVYPYIASEQIERGRGKAKAVTVFPAYCPFCGKPYHTKPAQPLRPQR